MVLLSVTLVTMECLKDTTRLVHDCWQLQCVCVWYTRQLYSLAAITSCILVCYVVLQLVMAVSYHLLHQWLLAVISVGSWTNTVQQCNSSV